MDLQPIEQQKRKLTLKQRKWIEAYIETNNATEAAMRVYNCKDRDSANALGSENLAKLSYSEFLEAKGLTDNALVDKLAEGLESNKTISARITGKDADSQTDDFIDVPDYMARHKYLETALKLKRRLVNEKAGDINIKDSKVMIVPSDLVSKYGISHNAESSS